MRTRVSVIGLIAVVGAVATLLVGCEMSPIRTTSAGVGSKPGGQDLDTFQGLVRYAQWLRERTPEALDAALGEAEQRARASDAAAGRVRLALVLSVPGASFRDEARARALLDEVIRQTDEEDTEMRAFAAMLAANLQDRQWVREHLERRLSAERQRREQLERKLEELKDIEQQLQRREEKDAGALR
jgi:hypothetical protein